MSGKGWIDCTLMPRERWWKSARFRLNSPHVIAGWTIPAGFVSDGASVPIGFRWLFNPLGEYALAAVLHDYLLTIESRKEADYHFRKAMKFLKVPSWRVNMLFYSVRMFSLIKGVVKSGR